MTKILSQSGTSLADVYDVEGSIAGIDELISREVNLVHEMGGTIFAERVQGNVLPMSTGPLLQNVTFDETLTGPEGVWRVFNVMVIANVAARVDRAQVSLRYPTVGREQPIFIWDTNDGRSISANIRIVESGGAVGNQVALIPSLFQVPSMGVGPSSPRSQAEGSTEIVFRGLSTGFGAGNITLVALIYIARLDLLITGSTPYGLPIPGW